MRANRRSLAALHLAVVASGLTACASSQGAAPTLPPLANQPGVVTVAVPPTVAVTSTTTTPATSTPVPTTALSTTTVVTTIATATTATTLAATSTTTSTTAAGDSTTSIAASTTTSTTSPGPSVITRNETPETWIMQLGSAPTGATEETIAAQLKKFAEVTSGVKALETGDWPATFTGESRVIFYVGGFSSKDAVIARCGQLGLSYPDKCLARFLTKG